jgi:hypothetical protein
MRNEVTFDRGELDRLEDIVAEQRAALVEGIVKVFPEDKVPDALGFALAMLFESAFTDDAEQQHDAAMAANQVLARK